MNSSSARSNASFEGGYWSSFAFLPGGHHLDGTLQSAGQSIALNMLYPYPEANAKRKAA